MNFIWNVKVISQLRDTFSIKHIVTACRPAVPISKAYELYMECEGH